MARLFVQSLLCCKDTPRPRVVSAILGNTTQKYSMLVDALMEDTESSDYLSSCDSLYSVATTSDRENANYVDFDVFLSDGLEEAGKPEEEDYGNAGMLPNSRLRNTDHPALIRLENEYQARRSFWYQRSGHCWRYPKETEGRVPYSSHPSLTDRDSSLGDQKRDGELKNFVSTEEARSCNAPQGLKRQRKQEADAHTNWWRDSQEKSPPKTEGDRIFAQKCRELQGFVKPLTDLLNGLRRGRYDRGLSSFQQSVAMDRIQRIVGVLQKPEMGERYLGTLLQVEMMLKVWFPGVTSNNSSSSSLSSDYDMEEPQHKMAKHPNASFVEVRSPYPSAGSHTAGKPREPQAVAQPDSDCKERVHVLAEWPAMNLTLMHPSPICNPPLSQGNLHHLNGAFGQGVFAPNSSSCGIILLLHNNVVSSSPLPRPTSATLEETLAFVSRHPREETSRAERPVRSQSAPANVPVCSGSRPLKTGGHHSQSLPHLPVCSPKPAGENT
ncbi:circadian-associated transcriptional repressor isoform X1 [Ascaphus truei]|uniref:circadian-associated transcriptional repressor isoform X1 n=2 Tax=Ascaphus truei TaxID=8439 RepID=UPI003F59D50B